MKFPWKLTVEEEFQKDPKLNPKDFEELKEWYRTQKHLPIIDDEMMLHFYHACFYNHQQAKIAIDYFYNYKNTMPDFFDNWDTNDNELQFIINNVLIAGPLPYNTSDGYRVLICKLNDRDTTKFNYPICVKWLLMSCMHSIWERGTQNGYTIVYDCTGFTMSHLLKCSLTNIKNYINYGKNASPLRVLKIVFINTSPVVKKLVTLIKPFLSKEIINMMSFHTSAESYLKELDKKNIPEDYGGEAPPLLTLHREYMKEILLKREWLMEEEKLRADDTKRAGKSKKENKQELETNFKKLEID